MSRPAEGEILERGRARGRCFALRFRAYGERRYLTLGYAEEGWDRAAAEEELLNVMADVRRGLWVPAAAGARRTGPVGEEDLVEEAPILFGPFATDIVAARVGQVSESTCEKERWALGHLLPYFAEWPLVEIDAEAIDGYRLWKVRESEARARAIERGRPTLDLLGRPHRPLAPSTINQTIRHLRHLLQIALEYGHVERNWAAGRRRLLREERRPPVYLDTVLHIEALLEAAARLDRQPGRRPCAREAIVGTLIFAGPRSAELGSMLERDIDLGAGRISVGRSKTQAGLREIPLLPILRDILGSHKARPGAGGPDDLAFATARGRTRERQGLARRILRPVVEQADELLRERGHQPLPRGLTPHKLRHTFASILVALGEDPISLMAQVGHAHPGFTLRVYSHMMRRGPDERARLKSLADGEREAWEAPRPRPLGSADYEGPILRALAGLGGRASRAEVIAAVGEASASRQTPADLERLPSGEQRWRTHVGKARSTLVRRGLLAADAPRGLMELTPAGLSRARRAGGAAGRRDLTAARRAEVST